MLENKTPRKAAKAPLSKMRREQNRREFLRSAALTAGMVGVSLAGLLPLIGAANARLRPPGALKDRLDEQQFLAACIKCGQCVQVCPVEAIKLADLSDGVGVGVPFIDARAQACDFSCDGLQCVLACPTGALTHDLDFPADTRMGFARLDRPDACLAMQGQGFKGMARGPEFQGKLRYAAVDRWTPIPVAEHPYDLDLCDLCVRQCPIEIRIAECAEEAAAQVGQPGQTARVAEKIGHECPPWHAIALEPVPGGKGMMPVVKDGCVGCGVCEMICPVQPTAIVIDIDNTTDAPA
jgi:ferredoxin-type protein NapG